MGFYLGAVATQIYSIRKHAVDRHCSDKTMAPAMRYYLNAIRRTDTRYYLLLLRQRQAARKRFKSAEALLNRKRIALNRMQSESAKTIGGLPRCACSALAEWEADVRSAQDILIAEMIVA